MRRRSICFLMWLVLLVSIPAKGAEDENMVQEEVHPLVFSFFGRVEKGNFQGGTSTEEHFQGGLIEIACAVDSEQVLSSILLQLCDPEHPSFLEETELSLSVGENSGMTGAQEQNVWLGQLYLPSEAVKKGFSIVLSGTDLEGRDYQTSFTYDFQARCDEAGTQMKHRFDEERCCFCLQKRVITGWSGDILWQLDRKIGELGFSGQGMMRNYLKRSMVPWREYNREIISIVISQGITRIGANAFYGLTSLRQVTIPEGLTVIGDYAFKKCKRLREISLPSSIQILGSSAFYGCEALQQIILPEKVDKIGEYCFSRCTGLESIRFEGDMPEMGKLAMNQIKAQIEYPLEKEGWYRINELELGGELEWTKEKNPC